MRTETDFLGTVELPADALYGIHSARARENFPDKNRFHKSWYRAVGLTKLACYQTYKKFLQALDKKYPGKEIPLRLIPEDKTDILINTAMEVAEGKYFDHFIVPAISGGAGTSINMNVNEIIANAGLGKMNKKPGEYRHLDPIEDANIYQSTNDVIPTSLKVAVTHLLTQLEDSINALRDQVEGLEGKHRNDVKSGYTQMQEAVPTSFGKVFSNYSEALSRDWWRVSRAFERIKVVNLGGSALGTGITVPQYFLMEVVNELRKLTGQPFTRSENMTDATSNMDVFVEIHAILKAHAVNLEKMSADLRLLGSDLHSPKEVELPARQAGSSIMPGKVNPVIPEFSISAAHKIYTNDQLISNLAGQGQLDLNAYIPTLGHALLESLELLIASNQTLRENLIKNIGVNTETAREKLYSSPPVTTALIPFIGYHKAGELAKYMKEQKLDIFEANKALHLLNQEKLKEIIKPENLVKNGFTIGEILNEE